MNSANDLVPSIARLKATDEGDDIVRLEEPSPSATSSEVLECKKGEPDPDEAPFVYRGVVYERDPEAEFPPFYYPKKALGATSSESVDYMTAYPTPESIKSLIQKRDTVRFIEPKVDAESKPNEAFCSWKLVEKYAELYVGKANGPKVGYPAVPGNRSYLGSLNVTGGFAIL